jgi:hypothetical protein
VAVVSGLVTVGVEVVEGLSEDLPQLSSVSKSTKSEDNIMRVNFIGLCFGGLLSIKMPK